MLHITLVIHLVFTSSYTYIHTSVTFVNTLYTSTTKIFSSAHFTLFDYFFFFSFIYIYFLSSSAFFFLLFYPMRPLYLILNEALCTLPILTVPHDFISLIPSYTHPNYPIWSFTRSYSRNRLGWSKWNVDAIPTWRSI